MSTATDILGKIGEKVGLEIKDIKDNFATKVSLGNVSGSIDFSPYATVVSLGSVKSELKASLASYTSGNSVFTNLKAQRAEVDELVVKGDTTIVNTQTVEVSDNVIEVNLAADDDITADTGGLAVNRGLIAESSTIDYSEVAVFEPKQSTFSTEGVEENVINEIDVTLERNGDLAEPIKYLLETQPQIKFVKPVDATNPSMNYVNGQHFWVTSALRAYEGVIDFGFHIKKNPSNDLIPEFLRSKKTYGANGGESLIFKHGVEDLGSGNQDVWRRIDSMPNAEVSKYYFDADSGFWTLDISAPATGGGSQRHPADSISPINELMASVPYVSGMKTKVEYIDVYGDQTKQIAFSESDAKTAGAELGPDLVKYILRDDNPLAHATLGNNLGRFDNQLNGPETKVGGQTTNLPEYVQTTGYGQSVGLDTQLENEYSLRAYFTDDNKIIAKAVEHSGTIDANGQSEFLTVLESTSLQIGTWANDGTDTTISAASGFTMTSQFSSVVAGNVNLYVKSTEDITSQDAGTYSVAPVSFTDEPFELGTGDWHNFTHANGEAYYWRSSFTNSTYNQTIQVLQSTTDGSGDIRFRVDGSNVGSCNYKGELYQQTGTSGYSDISVTWSNQGTHNEIESVTVTYSEPGGGTAQTFVPDTIAYESTSTSVVEDAFLYKFWTNSTKSLRFQPVDKVSVQRTETGSDGLDRIIVSGGSTAIYSDASNVVTWQVAGVNGDAELLWDEPKGAWTLNKDGGAAKLYYGNIFPTASDLPSASTYHGMFAHVHDTGRGYFAHNGAWQEILDLAANQTVNGNLEFSAGNALKVADSSGIVINNVSLGNYASFESALTTAKS